MLRFLFLFFSIWSWCAHAQTNTELETAEAFFLKGEYDKAITLYEKAYKSDASNYLYKKLYYANLQLNDFKSAEKLVKKRIKQFPSDNELYINLGVVYNKINVSKEANKAFNKAIELLQADISHINKTANEFIAVNELDFAINTYLKGSHLFHGSKPFYFELAGIYERQKKPKLAISNYLLYLKAEPTKIAVVKTALQNTFEKPDYYNETKKQLYAEIRKSPNNIRFSEMLIWLFLQKNNYTEALIQTKALDKRLKQNGLKVYNLGNHALVAKEYDAAINAFQYVVANSKSNYYFIKAKEGLLKSKKDKIVHSKYNAEDIESLKNDYETFIAETGNAAKSIQTIRDLSELYALYIHDLDKAIELLNNILPLPNIKAAIKASCKLDLANYYLMQGERWEATLLYSQVDKAFKEDPLGEKARFLNAKLAYYFGEFEWSQAQLDILKASTTELIANDALDLSIFILSHYNLDSSTIPMQLFANADLLIFQRKYDEAINMLDELSNEFPGHLLTDDIYFAKAKIMLEQHQYKAAILFLQKIIDEYPQEILADNALYLMGNIYKNNLQDTEKAKDAYQNLLLNYKGSVFVIEARKQFRVLRGDKIN